jgi:ferredoxin--NADP+ reductase
MLHSIENLSSFSNFRNIHLTLRGKIFSWMNKIVKKEYLSANVFRMVIEAPHIAASRKAGHFVIVRPCSGGERIPLTIADADLHAGTITLIVQQVGCSTAKLARLNEGGYVCDVVGPLGNATHIEKTGTVLCAGGGVGVAPLYPIVQAFKQAGNKVITVLAARSADLLIYEKEMAVFSDEVILVTNDGSRGRKGLVTDGMEEVILREKINQCVVIGPAIMMKFASLLTQKYHIPTMASLNTIMVDGTGMCGACRCSVGGETKFVCVDGPEFDAHQVDFDEMLQRMAAYRDAETAAYEQLLHQS